ncbi:MAG TPA: copper homeostasis protein CutC [Flavobacteriaceae bacterium]|nr:copper homeostasis protein CutC [Flavobacteriaceae bacterium]
MLLEICTTSLQSAKNAQTAGAHRIELCSELAVGGITPSYGLIQQTVQTVNIPVFVLIRPRGGTFTYSEEEFEVMLADIEICKKLGVAGIVSGVLHSDNTLDSIQTQRLVECAAPLEFTFHRAFDQVPDAFETLSELEQIGVKRILSSGQQSSAETGLDLLVKLKEKSQNVLILPGGGIHAENVFLFQQNGFTEIHASVSGVFQENNPLPISMNSPKFLDETKIYHSDIEKIRSIINKI